MKHFTQYLYEYHKGKKIRNVGFVKGEIKEKEGWVSIQARGISGTENEPLFVYLFYRSEEKTEAVFQGEIRQVRPVLSYRLDFSSGDTGNAKTMDGIEGVLLTGGNEKKYAAVFNGEEIDVNDVVLFSEEESEEEPDEVQEKEPEEEEEIKASEEEQEKGEEAAQETEEQKPQICYNKIQRKDLTRLPRREWRIANNSFLLHGYYNYHHLLWIEEEGNLYIGVPGIYHEKELQAAKAFGFQQFREFPEEIKGQEDLTKDFGYFCRRITID